MTNGHKCGEEGHGRIFPKACCFISWVRQPAQRPLGQAFKASSYLPKVAQRDSQQRTSQDQQSLLTLEWVGGGIENTIKIKPRDNGRSREGSLRALWEGRKDSAVFWRCREEAVAAADPSGVSFFYSRTISKPVNATLRDAAWRIAKTILSSCINQSLFHSPKKLNSFLRAPCSVITVCIWRCGCWLSLQAEWYRASPFEVGFTVLNMLVWQYSLLTAKEELKMLTISRVFGEWKPKQKPVTMKRLRIGVQVKTDCP